ncbi:MAG: hypothetical protein NC328_06365 [Muribaculum sp.]|nr:hypothetical protein [Muribaculum sp.]
MKKFFAFTLCVAAVASVNAQKANVDQAKKLAGKLDKIEEARSLIQQAINNPETAKDANTYFVAGKIEWDAFDKANSNLAINPNDEKVNKEAMGPQLLNGYNYFLQVIPLDQLPNEKGEIKPKYTKDVIGKIASHADDFFTQGANLFNNKQFYPEAYNAFMIYGDLPTMELLGNKAPQIPDSIRATSYYNAGLAGWSANKLEEAAKAFKASRLAGYPEPEAYIYEIACWQNIAGRDTTMIATSDKAIADAAAAGFEKFGLSKPIFFNNMINGMINQSNFDGALNLINTQLANTPDNANLYGLRAFVYDRKGDNDASLADYIKAASLPDADFETLKNAAKKVLRVGTEKLNDVDRSNRDAFHAVKTQYFDVAKQIAEQAKAMKADDSDLLNVLDNIDYALETYFQ